MNCIQQLELTRWATGHGTASMGRLQKSEGNRILGSALGERVLTARPSSAWAGPCNGDSGGPAFTATVSAGADGSASSRLAQCGVLSHVSASDGWCGLRWHPREVREEQRMRGGSRRR